MVTGMLHASPLVWGKSLGGDVTGNATGNVTTIAHRRHPVKSVERISDPVITYTQE